MKKFLKLRTSLQMMMYNISPKLNIRYCFLLHYNYYKKLLSFKKPITLDEKIQWMKVHLLNNDPIYSKCADKYAVREYLKECKCGEILNELYGAYDNPDEIEWDKLPNQFVIKWNFGCGQNFICRNKKDINIDEVKKLLVKWKSESKRFYKYNSEMQYKNIVPKLICEKLIETKDGFLPVDYKLYCFNGKPECLLTCTDRESGKPEFYFVDKNWKLLRYNKSGKKAPVNFEIEKPLNYEQLFKYAEILSKPFPFVRADFYLENGNVIFGELTFTPSGGIDTNRLIETNIMFGNMVTLPL